MPKKKEEAKEVKEEKKPIYALCKCGHAKTMHFGGPLGWCNMTDCRCSEFK